MRRGSLKTELVRQVNQPNAMWRLRGHQAQGPKSPADGLCSGNF